jgi:hypothetical protein
MTPHQRLLLFLFGCIPIRLLLAYIPQELTSKKSKYVFATLLAIIATGFLYLGFTNGRLDAQEAGGKTWWVNFRIVHGALFLAAAILVIKQAKTASIPLLVDAILGILLFFTVRVRILA